jgi:hypothetical protein
MLETWTKQPRQAFRRGPFGAGTLQAMAGRLLASLLALLCLGGVDAFAAASIGSVSRIEGTATATVGGETVGIGTGADVFTSEVVVTGIGARLEITLADKTTLTLGENARLTLDDYVFNPRAATRIDLTVNGAFRYVSGKLGVGATRMAEVTTPFATLGARGTDFWGGPIDGHFGVVALEGTVTVTHRGRTIVLNRPLQGTDFATPRSRPGPAHAWAQPKLQRALASITFP